jgi:hypothetical protein
MDKIYEFLKENTVPSALDRIFWIHLPEDILSPLQFEHKDCQPFAFAAELGEDWIRLEFLIRSTQGIRCDCSGYATREQLHFIHNFIDSMINRLELQT